LWMLKNRRFIVKDRKLFFVKSKSTFLQQSACNPAKGFFHHVAASHGIFTLIDK
jgi:hypothetical protein